MGDKTGIQWTDATWNPIVGCSIVSPACTNCYAMAQAARIQRMAAGAGRESYYDLTTKEVNGKPVWTGVLKQAPEHILTLPLRWKKPRRIFVNSMSDLFHESVPDEWLDRVFAVMQRARRHTFQLLTKRPQRMREYLSKLSQIADGENPDWFGRGFCWPIGPKESREEWPFKNICLGVTAEDQPRADERIPDLLATPAAVRFVSVEPMLGPINLKFIRQPNMGAGPFWLDALDIERAGWFQDEAATQPMDDVLARDELPCLDWVICGGESGPGARPMHPDWARSLRDQCAAAGVPFFFKQWGEWTAFIDRDRDDPDWRSDFYRLVGQSRAHQFLNIAGGQGFHGDRLHVMQRVGKKLAGRLLDGREHNEFPEARA